MALPLVSCGLKRFVSVVGTGLLGAESSATERRTNGIKIKILNNSTLTFYNS